ncbi:hypothetical protein K501DRAFT_231993 [Backusella circina FSU 941]|nr:hypothetical protein K501DRAFT_231993 [Backusella circina FSU 941]
MNTTLAEIVSKIASQGSNPDVSFLKDNPEAQAMLLLALLSNTANTNKDNNTNDEGDKRKYDSIDEVPRKVGRKPVISEEDDSDDPKNKRKVQNRAAQRAFRERKENRVRLLEDKVKELEDLNNNKNSELQLENDKLKDMISQLQKENATLLSSSISFDYPLSTDELHRPQKIIKRGSLMSSEPSPVFDTQNSPISTSSSSISNKSRSNTPEKTIAKKDISIDDILGLSTAELPSTTLLDHSELLGHGKNNGNELDSILQGHTFASDPSQFDFFYPLEVAVPMEHSNKKDNEGEMIVKDVTKAWDQVTQHPRFDEFDMDVLCDEMHKKAVCGDELDHDEEMKKLIDQYYPITE